MARVLKATPAERAKRLAWYAVSRALKERRLPMIEGQGCAICGSPAKEYHHWRGYGAEHHLDVQALCTHCHRLAHRGERRPAHRDPSPQVFVRTAPINAARMQPNNGDNACTPMPALPLRTLRDRKGYSQEELARRAGVAERTIANIERGGHRTFGSTRRRIAEALGLDDILAIKEFADGDGDPGAPAAEEDD